MYRVVFIINELDFMKVLVEFIYDDVGYFIDLWGDNLD
jgi:hypothetical protein